MPQRVFRNLRRKSDPRHEFLFTILNSADDHGTSARLVEIGVAKAMVPILEVNELLRDYLDQNKIRGKHWIRDFADLIVDRTWERLDE